MTKKKDTKSEDINLAEELSEMEGNWKRALADYQNLQKRVAEEKEEMLKFANLVLISQLLPVLDNLELLGKHNKDEGIKMIIKGFKDVLKDSGVKEIEVSKGDDFDPLLMEAVEANGEGSVSEVLQPGYKLSDKLIRPTKVIVGKKEA